MGHHPDCQVTRTGPCTCGFRPPTSEPDAVEIHRLDISQNSKTNMEWFDEMADRIRAEATAAERERLRPWIKHKTSCAKWYFCKDDGQYLCAVDVTCTCGMPVDIAAALREGD